MTRFLVLSIRFLDDRYHGVTRKDGPPEWPPSPFRLLQALVAGNARDGAIPPAVRSALLWLESLPPPAIIAPDARKGQRMLTYVLNPLSDTDPGSRTPKPVWPTVLNGDRLLQYVWRFDAAESVAVDHARAVAEAARRVRCLGWGIDLAIGSGEIADRMPPALAPRVQYCPSIMSATTDTGLRTPRVGTLESLERAHAQFLERWASPGVAKQESPTAYARHAYVTGLGRPYVAFRLMNADGDTTSLQQQLIAPLVGMIRDLANRPHVVASLGQEVVDREIKGHPKESSPKRVSILPLPTIREGHTDGRIRRVLVAQPFECDGELCRLLARLLDGQELSPLAGDERFPPIFLQHIREKDAVLPFYTATARVWSSVTPVLLPGYDDRKQHRGDQQKRLARAAQLTAKALAQADIEAAAEIELSPVPFWPGSLHVREYVPREKLRHYPRYHVRLAFDRPVTGPLAIGAGRHCGFGVLAAAGD